MNGVEREEGLGVVFVVFALFGALAAWAAALVLPEGLSLNNRVDRQRDFLCAKYADADATLRDCPKANLAERIKELERELERLREEKR